MTSILVFEGLREIAKGEEESLREREVKADAVMGKRMMSSRELCGECYMQDVSSRSRESYHRIQSAERW